MLSDPRSRSRAAVVAALLLGMVLGAVALRVAGGTASGGEAAQLADGTVSPSPTTTTTPVPGTPTQFTISTLNVLGAGHTSANGNKKGWAPGPQRMAWLTDIVRASGVDVIGFQELELPQYRVFMQKAGAEYGIYPGQVWGPKATRNSVAWKLDEWELVSASWVEIPYFHGNTMRMPVVLLRNLQSGQQAYFSTFHNPANARGPAATWRKRATQIEVAMVNRLRAESGLPVYVTGDMNERDIYFCRMTAGTDMVAANGGVNDGGGCGPARPTYIDWIFGSPETTFSGYVANRGPKVRRSTDHPMIIAQAALPPVLADPDCPATPTDGPTPTPTPTPTGSPTPNVP
ncbi:endonuclease/exonuclease/phosphatase family protein [Nocardioides sp. T2.26MG-1]|uniref:endonuclease/exonuclease/phosphatase family protein n=1 Tax=Nocardioides sp. T2.26MG-1 TaxID=3041166 RepID=UPI0024779F93|nr:endonuclease/exonuclease/phosphatase family protein [Nocardioides sp. T2.26MG-1]CAI9407985.1 hypothetical protein HIDPHFAB_00987 [Nocardioides sp. T2.26MG-1]